MSGKHSAADMAMSAVLHSASCLLVTPGAVKCVTERGTEMRINERSTV